MSYLLLDLNLFYGIVNGAMQSHTATADFSQSMAKQRHVEEIEREKNEEAKSINEWIINESDVNTLLLVGYFHLYWSLAILHGK